MPGETKMIIEEIQLGGSELNAGLVGFGYGYAVTGADGHVRKAVALGSQDRITLLVPIKPGHGGVERYDGLAGNLWSWCRDRGLRFVCVKLQASPNRLSLGAQRQRSRLKGEGDV